VQEVPGLLTAFGWGGAVVLAWIGWRALRAPPAEAARRRHHPARAVTTSPGC
jgi:hypothetical protein